MKSYNIPIISQDLRENEVCVRAIQTFQFLETIVDEVFDRIDARITRNMTKINDVNRRLEIASAKIESLKESKKSIRIYSPAKYPIQSPPTFSPTNENIVIKEVEFKYNLRSILSENYGGAMKYSDKLRFFHLKRNRQLKKDKQSLVFTTKSINALITFVNNENIIFNEPSFKLRAINKQSNVKDHDDENDSTDFSRFSTLMKNKHDGESFHYFPNMNQAPEIELPIDLPDLPGIVADIVFNIAEQDLIVPSLARMNIVNELPSFDDLIEAETSKKLIESEKVSEPAEHSLDPVVKPVMNIPPPPPPPIPSNFIPPPPPVPPASTAKIDQLNEKPKQSNPSTGDVRSSLMQAIRNAGGKSKLRTVPAADEPVPTDRKKTQAAPVGDLMSDLNAKLALRRRGIAGSKQAKKEKVSLMDKVSKLIPPPSSDTGTDHESSSDEEWD